MDKSKLKIAIVYDWIDKWGGVERLLLHLHTLFPQAVFFTSAVDLKNAQWAKHLTIYSSFLQRVPSGIRSHRKWLVPLFPLTFESFDFKGYDVVISVTSSFAKGIITHPSTKHICYLLTPPRYLWSHRDEYLSGLTGLISKPVFNHLQKWDRISSQRPDSYISISQTVADRARTYYDVASSVIYPPFDTQYWDSQGHQQQRPNTLNASYYLWVGRMEPYKKPELVIQAARKMKNGFFILVGTGALEKKLKNEAPANCQFAGSISDRQLSYLYSHAKALIMPQNEDFGYVSLEAQYFGCPVIAYRSGGAVETVSEGVTGLFFKEQTASSLVSELERFEQISYNLRHSTTERKDILEKRFGTQRFDEQFINQLQHVLSL